jgi:hypothetical protein
MTIDRGFLELWKAQVPEAFTDAPPFIPANAFVDGQLRLMRPSGITTWDALLLCQFVNPINHLFSMGAKRVVLGFDHYKLVPLAKAPTQRLRTKKIACVPWDADASLPPSIPEKYEQMLFNRAFKAKVCQFVVSNIADRVQLGGGRSLIIDWNNLPLEFTDESDEPQPRSGFTCLGECDVKWCQHLVPGESTAVLSVDGDYIMISLLQIEQYLRAGETPPRIMVKRVKLQKNGQGTGRREYEWLHCNLLYHGLRKAMHSRTHIPAHMNHAEMRLVAILVAITGCDFVGGLPGVGPRSVWRTLTSLIPRLVDAYEPHTDHFDVSLISNFIVLPLLMPLYRKQAALGQTRTLQNFLDTVSTSSSLTTRQRSKLPTASALASTIRNSIWTVLYWIDAKNVPNPVQTKYGFSRMPNGNVERDPRASLV